MVYYANNCGMLTYFVVPCQERVGPPGGGPEWEGRAAAAGSGLSPTGKFCN
jgi:hypothetical protein